LEKLKELWFKTPDIYRRAIKTFIQCFLAELCAIVGLALKNGSFQFDTNFLKSILVSALAAGFSGLMNYIYNLTNKKGDE